MILKTDPIAQTGVELVYFTPGRADASFPYAIVSAGRSTFLRSDPPVARHYDDHTFILTLSGQGLLTTAATRTVAIAGTIAWINTASDYSHRCHPDADHWTYIWFGASGYGLEKLYAWNSLNGVPVFPESESQEPRFSQIVSHLSAPGISKGATSSALVSSVLEHVLSGARDARTANDGSLLQTVTAAVKADLAKDWSVRSMADLVPTSIPNFHRVFKREAGRSPMDWLKTERINAAKYLLAQTSLRIAAIGREVGFSDLYHFSREFKRRTGRSPSTFRKMATGNPA